AAAARSGIRSARDAEHPRRMRSLLWLQPHRAWASESTLLALSDRGQEVGVLGSAPVQRRSALRPASPRATALEELHEVALRANRPGSPATTARPRPRRSWNGLFRGRGPLGKYGVVREQQLRRIRLVRYHPAVRLRPREPRFRFHSRRE